MLSYSHKPRPACRTSLVIRAVTEVVGLAAATAQLYAALHHLLN